MPYGLGNWPRRHPLAMILLAALVHGLLHLSLVPPWQHYDEPTHFEYAWLVANSPSLPQIGDYDQSKRREVAASMVEQGFFRGMGSEPDLLPDPEPVWIGFSQLRHPPAYYMLVSLPLRLLRFADVTLQLYAARFVSLLLYLVSMLAAWGVMGELVPPDHALRWMVPATMAFLPGFADLMTAVNNDVGATAVFSVFLWGGVYLMRRGPSPRSLLWCGGTALLAIATKSTVLVALPLLALALLFSLFRRARRWVAWVLLLSGGVASLWAVFSWGDAAFWYRNASQWVPTRVSTPRAPFSAYSFQLQTFTDRPLPPTIRQFLPVDEVIKLRGKTVTLGAWMWSTQPLLGYTPILIVAGAAAYDRGNAILDTVPGFYAIVARVPENANHMWIALEQPATPTNSGTLVYYNGLVLAEGQFPIGESPEFDDPHGTRGVWGGKSFRNLLRNASADSAWLRVRSTADSLGAKILYNEPSFLVASLIDREGAGWYYAAAFRRLFWTFWATFGWGGIFLQHPESYVILGLLTLAAGIAIVPALWRRRRALDWDVCFLFLVAMLGIWGPTILRGLGDSLMGTVYIPVARYAYPAMIPAVGILVLGWFEILLHVEKRLHVPWSALASLYIISFLAFDVYAIISLVCYFNGG